MTQMSLGTEKTSPLADRMRPRSLDEMVGIESVVPHGCNLERAVRAGRPPSIVLWGPPGCGKTTLARILAVEADLPFIAFSAVASGVKEIRRAVEAARIHGRIVLFVDEIHRFNKAQQDAFLHAVEEGSIVLMGATTENPSFELNAALLSRVTVVTLPPIDPDGLRTLITRAVADERGLNERVTVADDAVEALVRLSGGDARRALNFLELAAEGRDRVEREDVAEAARRPVPLYDKDGEGHFNLISALHKSVRNSDPDAALYYLARMLIGGEDPLYIARRLMRAAVEDVGLADPHALSVATAAQQAVHFMGMPECALALAQLAVYLAAAPKSNAIYRAYGAAERAARSTPAEPVPLHLRNAPTKLMKELGYGGGYRYAHDEEGGVAPMACLPTSLAGERFYHPRGRGFEEKIVKLLEAARAARQDDRGRVD